MIKRLLKWNSWLLVIILVVIVSLGVITNVPVNVTESDRVVFRTKLGLQMPAGSLTYAQEIELIRSVQALIFERVPPGEPIQEYADREPEDLFKHNTGLCYDRSRTYDKVFSWLGFETRHIYILYTNHPLTGDAIPFIRALFTRGIDSHAVTEVKTSKGWVMVDSNNKWISIAANGSPINVDHLYGQETHLPGMPNYFKKPYIAIRGLYSRRGQFYRPYLPFPELNWVDFFAWIGQKYL
jgi:hypothetical protein